MAHTSHLDALVEERISQLEAITKRRNDLLRQMYYMMRRRNHAGPLLNMIEEGHDDLHVFLKKHDLATILQTGDGYIENLDEIDVFSEQKPSNLFPDQVDANNSTSTYVVNPEAEQNRGSLETRRPVIALSHSKYNKITHYNFDCQVLPETPKDSYDHQHRYEYKSNFPLPSLKVLPAEYSRKVKSSSRRKKEKEKEKSDMKRDKDLKDDWFPLGLNRWAAIMNTNPAWKKVSKASKCLSTREWSIAMTELRLVRAFDRIDALKDVGRWSFRQPKKQRGVGGLMKTHWDYLMDEMKWMRIDFREERRWKIAVAYNLSTAVLEWHAVDSWDHRTEEGICVRWKPSFVERHSFEVPMDIDEAHATDSHLPKSSLLELDYCSEDDDEEEQDKDIQGVVDALEPDLMTDDALDSTFEQTRVNLDDPTMEAKQEIIDDLDYIFANRKRQSSLYPDADEDNIMSELDNTNSSHIPEGGIKVSSNDPILGDKGFDDDDEGTLPVRHLSKHDIAAVRERIVHSGVEKLFIDSDELDIPRPSNDPNDSLGYENIDNFDPSVIFPDLRPLGFLDLPPTAPTNVASEIKKKSDRRSDRDDPNKRIEESTYTKLFPTGIFMYSKPTLLGTLKPSRHWKDGEWIMGESVPVHVDMESSTKIFEDSVNDLFDSRSSNSPGSIIAAQMTTALLKERDPRKRGADHFWSTFDDKLLKSLIEKYPNNWSLISECFNSTRITTVTDKRTPRDCLERWKEKWGSDRGKAADSGLLSTDDNSQQMTTRGVKRLTSSSASGSSLLSQAAGSEPKKRRRHLLVQDTIRKVSKKRLEQSQKLAVTQRKPPAVHETHMQYSKLPKHTPAELSRMKTEKDAQNNQEALMARRRQEEIHRQNQLREQAIRAATATASAPGRSQTQTHVAISRIATPGMGTIISPQQLLHMQQARASGATQQIHAQSLNQQTLNGINVNGGQAHVNSNVAPLANGDVSKQASPSRSTGTSANGVNSPRPDPAISIQISQVSNGARPASSNLGTPFYIPNINLANVPNQGYTHDQILAMALRSAQQQQPQ